ncbi:hypothetical protein [Cupriavidus pauculus]|uniref:hypothetical protein n=1 Tax=Cupriavidus pauculus TaxID=82633 RepID=UPI00078186E8|nr:hypothetical protein [Cupriavidus pauculus]
MSEPSNIDAFNDHVSQTFALLYERFPVPVDIDDDRFTYPERDDSEESVGTMEEEYEPIMHAVQWLIDEGYIRCLEQSMSGRFYAAQLTAKGLSALQATPSSLGSTDSLGKRITAAVSGGTKEVARKLAQEVIAWGFKQTIG